jgi:hypothetical protein
MSDLTRAEDEKLVADHERIWLEPMILCGSYGPEGRCWSHDNPWPEDQGDQPATEYVRADLHASLLAIIERQGAELAEAREAIEQLVALADYQAKFWRSHQRAAKDREEKTRFAVKAEPWENASLRARSALSLPRMEADNAE